MTAHPESFQDSPAQALNDIAAHLRKISAADLTNSKLIIASYGQNPETGEKIGSVVLHIDPANIDSAAREIEQLSQEHDRNVYMSLALMREDLPDGLKGSEDDIKAVLGLCADFDDEDAHNWASRLPLPPNYVLETSAGRFQCFYIFGCPLTVGEAKSLAQKLRAYANCDYGTADLSHVWRIAGTLNWPNKRKVDAGRSPQPQMVKVVKL